MENQTNNVVQLESVTEEQQQAAIKKFRRLHSAMFGEISSMLRTAKLAPMLELQKHDPSFTAMVVNLEEYLSLLVKLHEIFEEINVSDVQSAQEYLELIKALAVAIESDDPDGLGAAIAALDDKPYI